MILVLIFLLIVVLGGIGEFRKQWVAHRSAEESREHFAARNKELRP